MAQTDNNFIASALHIARRPIAEFDIAIGAGQSVSRADISSAIDAAGGSENFEYLTCQCGKENAAGEFVAKFALTEESKYDLAAGQGNRLTPLSQITLQKVEAVNLRFIGLEAGVNLHFVTYA